MKGKLRIVHVVNVRWFNATAWYGLYLAKLMKQAGHEVMVLGLGGTASFEKAKAFGLEPISFPLNTQNPFNYLYLSQSISELLSDFDPDIVNCHRGENYPLWAYLKVKHGFSLIRTRGDQRLPNRGFFNRFLHNYCTDAVVATSTANAKAAFEYLKLPQDKVSIILGGVDTSSFTFSAKGRMLFRQQYNIPESAFVVGLLGRFDHVKGQKELIQAFAKAQKIIAEGRELKLLLAGFPTEVSDTDVLRWIEEAGISDSAIITGVCEDVPGCISAMDLGVVASLGSEAIARVALEIMSTGVPLIGTTVGVMPDLLPAWAMVDPGDIDGLADLLCRAVNDSEWRERLREVNTTRMVALSNDSFLRFTIRLYKEVLASKKDAS